MFIVSRVAALLGACLGFGAVAPAFATVIDFDALPHGTTVSNQYAGVVFSLPGGHLPTIYQAGYASSPGNILLNDDALDDFLGEVLTISFLTPAVGVSFALTGDNGPATIEVFIAGAPPQVLNHPFDNQPMVYEIISLAGYGTITGFSVIVNWDEGITGPDLFGIDDLTYTSAAIDTPLPAALPLLAGLCAVAGACGVARRRA